MRMHVLALALGAGVALSAEASAQGLGIGGRVGTLGLGGEAAIGLGERFVVRGGLGVMPVEADVTLGGIPVTLEQPGTWYNVGVDLYLNGAMRIGGGLLFKGNDPELSATFTADQEIGGATFTPQEIGILLGVIDYGERVPYALIGFGRHTAPGIGLFIDVGVVFFGSPDFTLDAQGGTLSGQSGPLRSALDQEQTEFEDTAGRWLELWPIVSLGLRIGAG